MLTFRTITTRKRLNKCGLFRSVAQRKSLLSERNMAAQLRFKKLHLNKHQDFWNCVRTDESKVEMFRENQTRHISTNISNPLSSMVVERD